MYPPSNARLTLPPELEPAVKSVQEAAKETADNWDHTYRKPGRPVINLNAVKLDEHTETRTRGATTDWLGAALNEGQRIVLEAPARSGKTTTPVQFARRILSDGGIVTDRRGFITSSWRFIMAACPYQLATNCAER